MPLFIEVGDGVFEEWSSGEFPDDLPQEDVIRIIEEKVSSSSLLMQNNEQFVLEDIATVQEGSRIMYVNQGEIALNIPETGYDFIGSDDATTCHIILVKSNSGKCLSSHLDTPSRCCGLGLLLDDMVQTVIDPPESVDDMILDVYISGGILDKEKSSLEITISIIEELQSTKIAHCRLLLLNTCKFNTIMKEGLPFPKVIGMGFRRNQVGIMEALPMYFPSAQRCPGYLLRRAAGLCAKAFADSLNIVYNGLIDHSIRIPFFESDLNPLDIDVLLALDDASILQQCSTSSHCEPHHFCEEFREALLFCRQSHNITRCFQFEKNEVDLESSNRELKVALEYQLHGSEWIEK